MSRTPTADYCVRVQLIHLCLISVETAVIVEYRRQIYLIYVGFNNGALLIRLNPVQIPSRTPRRHGMRRWGLLVRYGARVL